MAKRKESTEPVEGELTPQQKSAKTKAANKAKKEAEDTTKAEETKVEATTEEVKSETVEPKEEVVESPEPETPEPVKETKPEETTKPEVNVVVPSNDGEDEDDDESEDGDETEDLAKEFPADGSSKTLAALKLHSEYEYLYVGKFGGLFDPKTFTESMDKKAILYKNPYFKK